MIGKIRAHIHAALGSLDIDGEECDYTIKQLDLSLRALEELEQGLYLAPIGNQTRDLLLGIDPEKSD